MAKGWTDVRRSNNRRRWTWIVAVLVLSIGIGVLSVRHHRQQSAVQLAEQSLVDFEAGEYGRSSLAIRRAIQMAPKNPEVLRNVVVLAESSNSSEEIHWRGELADVDSTSKAAHMVDLAGAALRHQRYEDAARAVEEAREAGADSPAFYSVAGAVAIAGNRFADAEKAFARALELDPANPSHRLNLALTRVQSSDPAVASEARVELQQLTESGETQVAAARALVSAAKVQNDPAQVLEATRLLASLPKAAFPDRLMLLDAVKTASPSEVEPLLVQLKESAVSHPRDVALLMEWMGSNNRQEAVIAWSNELPPGTLQDSMVRASIAASLTELSRWQELLAFCQEQPWADIKYLRQAYLALAYKTEGDGGRFRAHWNASLTETGRSSARLLRLLRLSSQQQWLSEYPATLWAIGRQNKDPQAALLILYRIFEDEQNTQSMREVLKRMVEVNPDSGPLKNNVLFLSLLVGRDTSTILEESAKLVEADPGDPVYRSTHAFALLGAGEKSGALESAEKIPAESLSDPGIALTVALIHAANGQAAEAASMVPGIKTDGSPPPERDRYRLTGGWGFTPALRVGEL